MNTHSNRPCVTPRRLKRSARQAARPEFTWMRLPYSANTWVRIPKQPAGTSKDEALAALDLRRATTTHQPPSLADSRS